MQNKYNTASDAIGAKDGSAETPTENKLVSVVIPAYRAANYIAEALESVLYQTYSNWELVVVEDGSKDETEDIVQSIAKRTISNALQYIRHKTNLGLSATRNTGIRHARGDYIALLDHDDIWTEEHLNDSVKEIESQRVDLVYSTVDVIDEASTPYGVLWGPTTEDLNEFPLSLLRRNFITPSSVIMRREVFETVGEFDVNLRAVQDLDYWIRVVRNGFNIAHVEGRTCRYRRGHSSALSDNLELLLEECISVMRRHKDWSLVPKRLLRSRIATLFYVLGDLQLCDDADRDEIIRRLWSSKAKWTYTCWRPTQSRTQKFRKRATNVALRWRRPLLWVRTRCFP